jgi:hypothetical protein
LDALHVVGVAGRGRRLAPEREDRRRVSDSGRPKRGKHAGMLGTFWRPEADLRRPEADLRRGLFQTTTPDSVVILESTHERSGPRRVPIRRARQSSTAQRAALSTPGRYPVILEEVGGHPKSVTIPDSRGNGASLRVTRHPAQRKIVLSHWRDGICVASTPIELGEVPAFIGVLADALGDAVAERAQTPLRGRGRGRGQAPWTSLRLWTALRERFRPVWPIWAAITHLHPKNGPIDRASETPSRSGASG